VSSDNCITFKQHREEQQLLTLVDVSQVPETLQGRTCRPVQACRIRAEM